MSVREYVIPTTIFRNCYGHYEFLIMSFGMTNTRATNIELINRVYKRYLDIFVNFFIEDILIYSRNV